MQHIFKVLNFPAPHERMAHGFSLKPVPRHQKLRRDHLTAQTLHPKLIEWFAALDFQPLMVVAFQRWHPHHSGIHTDYSGEHQCYAAINFELQGRGGQGYYRPLPGARSRVEATPNNGRPSQKYNTILYKEEEVELIEHQNFEEHGAYLVQIDVPHRATVDTDHRTSVSIRLARNGRYLEWDAMVDAFASAGCLDIPPYVG